MVLFLQVCNPLHDERLQNQHHNLFRPLSQMFFKEKWGQKKERLWRKGEHIWRNIGESRAWCVCVYVCVSVCKCVRVCVWLHMWVSRHWCLLKTTWSTLMGAWVSKAGCQAGFLRWRWRFWFKHAIPRKQKWEGKWWNATKFKDKKKNKRSRIRCYL